MTIDDERTPPEPTRNAGWLEPGKNNLILIYVLYLLSLIFGVTAIVGLVFAYMSRGKAGGWVDSHYTWAIRTFWIGVLYSLICAVLAIILIGYLLMFLVAVWAIVRIVMGLQKASSEEPMPNPQSWLF
jgi:uncharacterized membrane protein